MLISQSVNDLGYTSWRNGVNDRTDDCSCHHRRCSNCGSSGDRMIAATSAVISSATVIVVVDVHIDIAIDVDIRVAVYVRVPVHVGVAILIDVAVLVDVSAWIRRDARPSTTAWSTAPARPTTSATLSRYGHSEYQDGDGVDSEDVS